MNPRISLCMIVKNEEAHLGRCLRSVQPYVNEIIVVDTGSTDGTVEIARQYGAQVYHHPWENDFSKHRNQSVGYATGEWILRLDADEELVQEDGPLLRKTVADGKADYYFLQFHDLHQDGSEHGVFYQIRLFRNGRGMIFERKVHEQLRLKGKGAYVPIRIRHYGYDLSPEEMERKHQARAQLLEEILARDPDDIYSRHQLTSCYSMHRDFVEAVRHGEMVLEARRKRQLTNSFLLPRIIRSDMLTFLLAILIRRKRSSVRHSSSSLIILMLIIFFCSSISKRAVMRMLKGMETSIYRSEMLSRGIRSS